jgi:hypothetical protein
MDQNPKGTLLFFSQVPENACKERSTGEVFGSDLVVGA